MQLKNISIISLFLGLLAAQSADADLFETLKNAAEIIKQTGVLDKSGVSAPKATDTGTETVNNGTKSDANKSKQILNVNSDLPLGLTEYPQAELLHRIDNPFDQLTIPISPPRRLNADKWEPRYTVPVEGKVTMLQFMHQSNDSPLLIQKHYESWLANNGFERMLVCKAPCKNADRVYWVPLIDPAKRMDYYTFPNNATYIAAYKENAMALVSIGQQGNDGYSSFVKLVEGKVIDNTNWKLLTNVVAPLSEVEPSKPANNTNSTNNNNIAIASIPYVNKPLPAPVPVLKKLEFAIPKTKDTPIGVQTIPFDTALVNALQNDNNTLVPSGLVALLITKDDCKDCLTEYLKFENSAKKYAGNMRFLSANGPENPLVNFGDAVKYFSFPELKLFKDGQYIASSYGYRESGDIDAFIKSYNKTMDDNNVESNRWNTAIKLRAKRGILSREVPVRQVPFRLVSSDNIPRKMLRASLNANRPEEVLNLVEGSEGVLVLHASSTLTGCSYCDNSNPNFEALASKYAGKATFMQAEAAGSWTGSFSSDFARAYQMSGIPATFVFKDGKLIRRINGFLPLDKMEDALMH